jgi:hypothetical protein
MESLSEFTNEQLTQLIHSRGEWAKALLSGEYQQGMKEMCYQESTDSPKKHCCLAVAAEAGIKNGLYITVRTTYRITTSGTTGEHLPGVSYRYSGEGLVMPDSVAEWLRMDPNPMFIITVDGEKRSEAASALNDEYGYSFTQIAELIEEQYIKPLREELNRRNKA